MNWCQLNTFSHVLYFGYIRGMCYTHAARQSSSFLTRHLDPLQGLEDISITAYHRHIGLCGNLLWHFHIADVQSRSAGSWEGKQLLLNLSYCLKLLFFRLTSIPRSSWRQLGKRLIRTSLVASNATRHCVPVVLVNPVRDHVCHQMACHGFLETIVC